MSKSESKPARIHLLPAKEAPVVIVLRQKPSRRFHVMRWNTETGELRGGSWFLGWLGPLKADVSFDGKYMVYSAEGIPSFNGWTGICEPPFLKTLLDWIDFGSGVFRSADLLEVSSWKPEQLSIALDAMAKEDRLRRTKKLPFRIREATSGEYMPIPRLERDGFVRQSDSREWIRRPSKEHPALHITVPENPFVSAEYRFSLPDFPDILDSEVDWANYDALGQLVFSRAGVLYLYRLEDIERGEPTFRIDLSEYAPPQPIPGRVPKLREGKTEPDYPEIPELVFGPVEATPAQVLLLPQSNTEWVRRIHRSADGNLPTELAAGEGETIFATSGYYLLQHSIVHIREPLPGEGADALSAVCEAVFRFVAEMPGYSIATRPIGLDAGWPVDVAFDATWAAAERFMAETKREVFIVADDEAQRDEFYDRMVHL